MKTLICFGLLLFAKSIYARVLLVTDIDDTIKVSHVLDADSAVANATATRNAFMGVPELYQALAKLPEATPMQYLSNAPRWLMEKSHKRFLSRNQFPRGVLWLNQKTRDPQHKIKSLRKMIETYRPNSMILIGDNGEHDNEVYQQIRKEFPQIFGPTYIHLAYSLLGFKGSVGKPLLENQIGWATSVDLAFDLMNKGHINLTDYLTVVNSVEERALNESPYVERHRQMFFPAWFDCRDFKVPVLPNVSVELQSHIEKRCARVPYED